MKTYNTYAECKLANPDCEVYFNPLYYGFSSTKFNNEWKLASPDYYLMTVEKFLSDGNLFVDGDLYLELSNRVTLVGDNDTSKKHANLRDRGDNRRYILKAAALENKDNPSKHPHHDLIVEWANNTSKQLQIKTLADDVEWEDCSILAVIENPKFLARFKPQREFIKGHWYPCVYEKMEGVVKCVGDDKFVSNTVAIGEFTSIDMEWLGESLGEIKFGGEGK